MFTPVGGKFNLHESPLDAAIRETFEETGIRVPMMKFCGLLTETSPVEYNWINYVYLTEIDFVEPPYCNEGELKWISFEDILKVPTPTTDWYIYKYILENKPFAFSAMFDENIQMLNMSEELEGIDVFSRENKIP